ncbi:hypothetical protein [Collimonas pratensis]|uniref:hypothetical protein n=1 Tax=Collimonas pratensis TaxID=279113 RepID=UPI0012372CEC|nr:hypothetical protein [Collimonas pratensis]
MISSINRYFYILVKYLPLQQATPMRNQAARSRPDTPFNDRSTKEAFPARRAPSGIARAPGGFLTPHQLLLIRSTEIKGEGYSTGAGHTASTGTSKPGILCVTDGLDLCCAVAFGRRGDVWLPRSEGPNLSCHICK